MSGSSWAGMLQLVIWGGWLITMLWGSVLAVRGARNWATVLQVIGTSGMLAGAVSIIGGAMVALPAMTRGISSGSGGSTTLSSSVSGLWIFMIVGMILLLLGVVLFTAGYVGMCAKYGATERRAKELEGLVGQMQERIQSGI